MRRFARGICTLVCAGLISSAALAQDRQRPQRPGQGAGSMSALMLLRQKSVQDELKMSEDQVAKVTEASRKQGESMQSLQNLDQQERLKKLRELNQESEKLATEILKPDQAKRFRQIALQQKKTRAFSEDTVAAELKLTDDQKKQIKEVQDSIAKQRRELLGQGGGGGAGRGGESRQKLDEINKAGDDKMLAVLTADQRAKWKEMLGEPFKGEISGFQDRRRPEGGERRRRIP